MARALTSRNLPEPPSLPDEADRELRLDLWTSRSRALSALTQAEGREAEARAARAEADAAVSHYEHLLEQARGQLTIDDMLKGSYVACVECKQPQGAAIHDVSKSVTETGEAQHPFIPGPILEG